MILVDILPPSRLPIHLSHLTRREGTLPTPTLNPSLASNRNKPISHQPTTRTATRGQCSMPIDHEHKTVRIYISLIRASPALSAPMSLDPTRSTRLFLLQVFDNTQLIAHAYRGSHWPPAADRERSTGMTRRSTCPWAYLPQPDEPIYERLSPYVLCSTAYPCCIRNGKRHAAMPDTRRGHKGTNKSA